MTKRKVLIPLDGSSFSRQIVQVVRTFFDPDDVDILLFRAAYPPSIATDVAPQDVFMGAMPLSGSYDAYTQAVDSEYASATQEREEYRAELAAELQREVERLQQAGYSASAEVQFGEPAQRIIDFVADQGVELVAMTTHGRAGLGRLVLGSVAERVVRSVSAPVLLMRNLPESNANEAPGTALSRTLGAGQQLRIATATDGSTLAQEAICKAGNLAQLLGALLTVYVVASDRKDVSHSRRIMEEACRQIAQLAPRPEVVPLVGFTDEVLLEETGRNRIDLLCIGAFQDRGAGASNAIGPTAQRLVQHAPSSVLMYKGHRTKFRRILACVAVDDSLDLMVVNAAAQFARAMDAELRLLHVVPPSAASYLSPARDDAGASGAMALEAVLAQGTRLSELVKAWIARLEEYGIGSDVMLIQRGSVPEAILKTAHDGEYDLVVVGSRAGPAHFLGSVANGVVRYAEQSVLVLRLSNAAA